MVDIKIILAEAQGFCFGVKRALQIVEQQKELLILGDLIHNKQVVTKLQEKGKQTVYEVPKAPQSIAITAHGNTKKIIDDLTSRGFSIIDTTCPLVQNIYRISQKWEQQGYFIVILGDKNHVEVKGIFSRLKQAMILETQEDIDAFSFPPKIAIVCQSTFSQAKFDYLSNYIKNKATEVKIINTICAPTKNRQNATEKLIKKVDMMIVIGGFHSSNTVKLYQLSKAKLGKTYHISSTEQLQASWFVGARTIGIAAGASTSPQDIMQTCTTVQTMFLPQKCQIINCY